MLFRSRPPGASIQGVYIIYQLGKGDRLGWSGLLTLQLLSVFIELDAWAFRPQHSHFKMGMLTQIQVVNGIIIMIKKIFFKIRGSCLHTFIAAIKFLWKNTFFFFKSNGPVCLHKGCTCKREILKSVSSPNTFLRWIPT